MAIVEIVQPVSFNISNFNLLVKLSDREHGRIIRQSKIPNQIFLFFMLFKSLKIGLEFGQHVRFCQFTAL